MAVDAADRRLNKNYFLFSGEPIPPPSTTTNEHLDLQEQHVQQEQSHTIRYRELEREILSLKLNGEPIVLQQLTGTQVEVIQASSVHLEKVVACVVFIVCDGPVFVHEMKNCILVAQCHQLRVHDLENCSIFALVHSGRVIIEQCNNLRMGSYDQSTHCLGPADYGVDDFNWPTKQTPSPNYSILTQKWQMAPLNPEWGHSVWSLVRGEKWVGPETKTVAH